MIFFALGHLEAYIFKVTELFESTVVLFNDPVSGMMMFKHFGEDIGNGRGVIFRDFVFKISSKNSHHSIALEMNFTSFMGNINLRNLFLIVCLLGHYPIFSERISNQSFVLLGI